MRPTMQDVPPPFPPTFASTRDALHALACYVVAPAAKAVTGRIGLRVTDDGFGTPLLPDGTRVVVRGDRVGRPPDPLEPITTLRDAAGQLGVVLSPDPGVGHDLPPFEPDVRLAVDVAASLALGAFYALGQRVLDRLTSRLPADAATAVQLWPEHFDLATTVAVADGRRVNVGFSPGDRYDPDPYVYVGPHDTAGLDDPFWNAPFGAALLARDLGDDAEAAALAFIDEGLSRL